MMERIFNRLLEVSLACAFAVAVVLLVHGWCVVVAWLAGAGFVLALAAWVIGNLCGVEADEDEGRAE